MVARVTAGDQTHSGPDPLGAAREAAGAAGERLEQARAEATERLGNAAKSLTQKPRLRGVFHQWAFFVSLGAGAALVLLADGSRATIAAAIYAFSLSALLGVSALYHRVTWGAAAPPRVRRPPPPLLFLPIAGAHTPSRPPA